MINRNERLPVTHRVREHCVLRISSTQSLAVVSRPETYSRYEATTAGDKKHILTPCLQVVLKGYTTTYLFLQV